MASGFFVFLKTFFTKTRINAEQRSVRTLVYQAQEKGCGFATVKMALIHMSDDPRYAFLPEPRVEEAPDLATLIDYAADAGLTLRGYFAPQKTEISESAEFPILPLLRGEGGLHIVFLYARRRRRFLLLDPALGKRSLREKDLLALWNGQFLRIEGYEKKGEPPNPKEGGYPVYGRAQGLLSASLALLPMAVAALGLLFLDFSFPSSLTLACFSASVALSLARQGYLLRAMDRFDSVYFDGVDAKDLKRRKELFVHYHAYKKAVFATPGEIAVRASTLCLCEILFLAKDPYLAAATGVGVALTTVARLLLEPRLKSRKQSTEVLEGRYLLSLLSEQGRKDLRDELRSAARGYGVALWGSQSIGLACSVLSAVVFCLFQGAVNLQTIIFYLLATSFLCVEAGRLYDCQDLYEARRREEPYFRFNIAPLAKLPEPRQGKKPK